MSFLRIWIHFVWSVKFREKILIAEYREPLFAHMRQNAIEKNIILDRVNGPEDHVHALVAMRIGQTIEQIAQMLKGESAYWFNHCSGLNAPKLRWQREFFAESVGWRDLWKIRRYIDNQNLF